MSDQEQERELSHQELYKLVLDQRKELEETRKELGEFRSFVRSKVVPLEERVFAPKRASHREREVERATRPYRSPGDKRAVGFLADLKIDLRERVEALKELNSCREEDEKTGELGEFDWEPEENRSKFTAFVNFIAEEVERGRRKMVDMWDQYAISKDSRFGWGAVSQFKKSKTFDHMGDGRPSYEEKELTHDEKDEKFRKAEKDSHFKEKNAPSGGKAKGVGSRFSSGQSSSYGKKVEFVFYILYFIFLYFYCYDDACMTTFA